LCPNRPFIDWLLHVRYSMPLAICRATIIMVARYVVKYCTPHIITAYEVKVCSQWMHLEACLLEDADDPLADAVVFRRVCVLLGEASQINDVTAPFSGVEYIGLARPERCQKRVTEVSIVSCLSEDRRRNATAVLRKLFLHLRINI
jgi:hypothetical protein